MKPVKVRILDIAMVVVAVAAVVGVSIFAYGETGEASQVSIQSDEGEFIYPLNQTRSIDVVGPIGHTHIEIDGETGRVRVTESSCRDKICVAAGWLDQSGDWTACLPNRVFVRVEGGERSDGVDGQTY